MEHGFDSSHSTGIWALGSHTRYEGELAAPTPRARDGKKGEQGVRFALRFTVFLCTFTPYPCRRTWRSG